MISLEKIENDILELEKSDTCFAVCERLAWLYVVRDHLKTYKVEEENKLSLAGQSEFLKAVNGKSQTEVWKIIDSAVDAIRTLHPKMYSALMSQINRL